MKKAFLSLGMILMSALFAFADFTGSFLSNGTCGLYKNEADLAIGEGTFNGLGYFATMNSRIGLYTNFINGQGGQEQLLGNASVNKYFLGTSGNLIRLLDKLNTSAFVELNNTTTSRNINSKINANTASGYLSQQVPSFDPLSGLSQTYTEENSNEQVVEQNSWMVNNTFGLFDKLTLGLLVSHQGNSLEDTRSPFAAVNASQGLFLPAVGAPDFTYSFLNGNTTQQATGEYAIAYEAPLTRINTSARFALDIFTLDGFLGVNAASSKGDSTANYTYRETSNSINLSEQENQSAVGEGDLTIFNIGARLSKAFLNQRIKTGLTLQMGFGSGTASYTKTIDYHLTDVNHGALLSTTATTNLSEKYTYDGGDLSAYQFGTCATTAFAIEDNLNLSVGFGYRYNTLSSAYTLKHTQSRTDSYNDGDSETGDANDYTSSTAYSYKDAKDSLFSATTYIDLPVGFIWDYNAKWQFRAGALHQIVKNRVIRNTEESSGNTEVVTTRYGDGTTDIANNTITPQTTTAARRGAPSNTLNSSTSFTYGVGYKPLQNLNIDINAMFRAYAGNDGADLFLLDLDWYRSLYLSLTFFFDPVKRENR